MPWRLQRREHWDDSSARIHFSLRTLFSLLSGVALGLWFGQLIHNAKAGEVERGLLLLLFSALIVASNAWAVLTVGRVFGRLAFAWIAVSGLNLLLLVYLSRHHTGVSRDFVWRRPLGLDGARYGGVLCPATSGRTTGADVADRPRGQVDRTRLRIGCKLQARASPARSLFLLCACSGPHGS